MEINSNVIQSATSAVASLPALIIQRADPGLYNLLTNGVLHARPDFDRSKLTCRAMAEKMADMAGGQLGWSQLAEGMASEVALASVLEKALLLQRTLLTGKKEPNVAANQLAVEAVNQEADTLNR